MPETTEAATRIGLQKGKAEKLKVLRPYPLMPRGSHVYAMCWKLTSSIAVLQLIFGVNMLTKPFLA